MSTFPCFLSFLHIIPDVLCKQQERVSKQPMIHATASTAGSMVNSTNSTHKNHFWVAAFPSQSMHIWHGKVRKTKTHFKRENHECFNPSTCTGTLGYSTYEGVVWIRELAAPVSSLYCCIVGIILQRNSLLFFFGGFENEEAWRKEAKINKSKPKLWVRKGCMGRRGRGFLLSISLRTDKRMLWMDCKMILGKLCLHSKLNRKQARKKKAMKYMLRTLAFFSFPLNTSSGPPFTSPVSSLFIICCDSKETDFGNSAASLHNLLINKISGPGKLLSRAYDLTGELAVACTHSPLTTW